MTRKQIVFLIALGAFIVSFLLPAVRMSGFPGFEIPGYICALSALGAALNPLDKESMQSVASKPVYFAAVCSGLITPLFLATVLLLQRKKTERFGRNSRILVLCLLPACLFYFWGEKMYPQAGYFLWTAAMIIALYSSSPRRGRSTELAEVEPKKSGPEKPQELPLTQLSWTTE